METCAIYARISDDKKADAHGVKTQLEQCEDFAQQRGWEIAETYVDNDISAYSGVNRPEFERLVQDMERGKVENLIVWHVDRLCRRVQDLARVVNAAKEGNTQIHTIKAGGIDLSNASGELMAYLLGSVAQFEARHISERITASHSARVEEGKFRGARKPPFGYESVGGGMLAIKEDEAQKLRKWTSQILDGDSLLKIRRQEAQLGFKTYSSTLRGRLLNPAIAGLASYKGEITGKAVWPAIIEESRWRDMEAILTDPSRKLRQSFEKTWQGSGCYVCSKCGGKMKVVKKEAYSCRQCYGVTRNVRRVDALVDEVIFAYLSKEENRLQLTRNDQDTGVDVQDLRQKRLGLLERKNRLGSMFAQGAIDEAQLVSGTKEIRSKLDEIEVDLEAARERSPLIDLALSEEDLRERWSQLSADQRSRIIDMLVEVTILPSKAKGRDFDPSSIEFRWKNQ